MIISGGKSFTFPAQALGETTPSLSNGYFYGDTGLQLSGKFQTYGALYRVQPSVATVVDKVANSAARLTIKVWDNTPATGRVEDTSSPFARLIANPCMEMSPFNFWRWTFSTYDIYGEAFWLKQRDQNGQLVGFIPMHPSRILVQRDENGNIVYKYTLGVGSAGILTVGAEDVVAFLRYNPDNLMRGLSRLEPLRSTLLNEDASRRATASWWKRGARPSVVLKHPNELSQAAQDRLRQSFDARHAGADNMGGTNVLEEGLDLQVIQLNAEEMQYIESRKLNLQEVCMVFDVPPPVVHILDHATFSNITEQMRSMYRDTMSPRLEDIESVIDYAVRPEFYNAGERSAKFSLDEVLRGDFETRADAVVKLVNGAIMKPSEARPLFDLPDAGTEADKLFANASLVELGTKPETPPAAPHSEPVTPPTPEAPAGATPGPKALTVRSIMGRMSRVKANKQALRDSLVAEHEDALTKFFTKQGDTVVKAFTGKAFDPTDWNQELAETLGTLATATSTAIGSNVAATLGGQYNPEDIADWLASDASDSAGNINQATADEINNTDGSAEAIKALFEGWVLARAAQIALSRVATIGGLASQVAARQNDAKTKTWVVAGKNPRPSHEAMSGETVPLHENFSNGMNGPGDPAGGADEVAGCTCDLQFSKKG